MKFESKQIKILKTLKPFIVQGESPVASGIKINEDGSLFFCNGVVAVFIDDFLEETNQDYFLGKKEITLLIEGYELDFSQVEFPAEYEEQCKGIHDFYDQMMQPEARTKVGRLSLNYKMVGLCEKLLGQDVVWKITNSAWLAHHGNYTFMILPREIPEEIEYLMESTEIVEQENQEVVHGYGV
mgnify:CR=1 FL=1